MVKITSENKNSIENKIIDIFKKFINLNLSKNIILKAGDDDCSLINVKTKCNKNAIQLLSSTDMLHRKTDFPKLMSYVEIGWMAVAVNLSDIASMGGSPIGFLFSIGIPKSINIKNIKKIAKGMSLCSSFYETPIIGGDTDTSDELIISGTSLGISNSKPVKRSGAKVEDYVCITGYPGLAGLALSIQNIKLKPSNDLKMIYKHLFVPCPRIREGLLISKLNIGTSMIDTSDGIARSLYELRKNSNIGFEIYEDKIPINNKILSYIKNKKKIIFTKNILEYTIYSGRDFELLFTVNKNNIFKLKDIENNINQYYKKILKFNKNS